MLAQVGDTGSFCTHLLRLHCFGVLSSKGRGVLNLVISVSSRGYFSHSAVLADSPVCQLHSISSDCDTCNRQSIELHAAIQSGSSAPTPLFREVLLGN